jgi:hypothetical protein
MQLKGALLLLAALVSSPSYASDEIVKFAGVQERCVQVSKIRFGPGARWSGCSVTKGRWFATMGLSDLYQAQYCLEKDKGVCEARAFLVFANRAYTPEARLLLLRIDSGSAEYDDPVVIQTAFGDIMTVSARTADGAETRSYHVWRDGRWLPVDAKAWTRDVARWLPKGATIGARGAWPDVDTMSARAALQRDGRPSGEVADIAFAVKNGRFVVRKISLAPGG